MLETKKSTMKVLFVFSYIFLAVALVLSAIRISKPVENATVITYFKFVLNILAALAGFIYVYGRYKKNEAVYYKLFMLLVCLEAIFDLVATQANGYTNPVSVIIRTIICVNLVILTFAKDLGRQTSIGLAAAVLCVSLFNAARILSLYSNTFGIITGVVISLALALLVLLLVIGKYMDKAERGTK